MKTYGNYFFFARNGMWHVVNRFGVYVYHHKGQHFMDAVCWWLMRGAR